MADSTTRRGLLQASAGFLLAAGARAASVAVASVPSSAWLFSESGAHPLTRSGERWQADGIELTARASAQSLKLSLQSPKSNPVRLHVRWAFRVSPDLRFLGDAWERSYGDLAFRGMEPERILPWYVLATDGHTTHAFGVKTGPAALCFWQVDPEGISLWCDLRNGGRAVQLGSREIAIAEVISRSYSDRSAFQAAKHFCGLLCPNPRLPQSPIYGGNNWYYAYGHSSASDILQDSERIVSISDGNSNRPWLVIDDGWSPNATAGPWRTGNSKFPDMPKLASEMKKMGVRPGVWMRPLYTRSAISSPLRPMTLDPTDPQAAALIAEDLRTVISWGYELVKHDFSTFDLLGRWGSQMGAEITDANWNFRDRTRTNAEVIRDFYLLLRKAAGETMLLGCNTVGHLAAGIFEVHRIGDDTSGRDWNRTRRMGVNTLAFRLPQHNTFFAIDADCVGLTRQIDWSLNRQWLDLLARSGSPLFVSIAPDALGAEQKAAVKEAFKLASSPLPVAEPLDWLSDNQPRRWTAQGKQLSYNWYGQDGESPFGG
jgi:alpha-galactosidase